MDQLMTVAAKEVRRDDFIYNNLASRPEFRWVRITMVDHINNRVRISTSAWETVKHPEEGVTIRRQNK